MKLSEVKVGESFEVVDKSFRSGDINSERYQFLMIQAHPAIVANIEGIGDLEYLYVGILNHTLYGSDNGNLEVELL